MQEEKIENILVNILQKCIYFPEEKKSAFETLLSLTANGRGIIQ